MTPNRFNLMVELINEFVVAEREKRSAATDVLEVFKRQTNIPVMESVLTMLLSYNKPVRGK